MCHCPRAGLWQGSCREPGFVEGFGACLRVTLCQEQQELRAQTGPRREQARQLPPLLVDRPPPAWTTPGGLIAPFQQMHHEHFQPTHQSPALTFTHNGESLRLQGSVLGPEISTEDLRWCEGTALRERVQPCIFEDRLTRMGIDFREQD